MYTVHCTHVSTVYFICLIRQDDYLPPHERNASKKKQMKEEQTRKKKNTHTKYIFDHHQRK